MTSMNTAYFSTTNAKGAVKTEIVSEKSTDKKAQTHDELKQSSLKLLIRSLGGVKGKKGLSATKAGGVIMPFNLTLAMNGASAAATAMAPVVAIIPGSSGEWSALTAEFDEFIMDAVTVHFRIYSNTATQTSGWACAAAYDPINAGAYTSVAQVLEATQKIGPFGAPSAATSALCASPASAESRTGFYVKRFVCPKGPQIHDPNVLAAVGTGQWTTTGVATTAYGYFKTYFEAASAGVTQFNGYLIMHCRFRCRT